jgi:hypothetical protein
VNLSGRNLPSLDGSSSTYQLPAVVAGDDLRLVGACNASIAGLALVWDDFELAYGGVAQTLNFNGRLLTAKFVCNGRQEWDIDDHWWDVERLVYLGQYKDPPAADTVVGFPEWMRLQRGFNYHSPLLKLSPNTDGVTYRWQDWTQSIYVKGASDAGLKWNLIRVTPLP